MSSLSPARIMEVGMAFWPAKVLLSAIELGLFTTLGGRRDDRRELQDALGLHPRANPDFFDTLVALRFLERDGDGPDARYRNTPETALFLDRNSPQFMGGFLEMANARLYRFWGDLTEGLRTGQPQNEIKHTGASMFAELYSKPERLEQFMDAMSGISAGNFQALRREVRLLALPDAVRRGRRDRPAVDARGQRRTRTCTACRRPSGGHRIAERKIAAAGLADRVTAQSDRLLRGSAAEGRRHHDGHDPARLEPGEEDAPRPRGLRGAAARRRVRRRREPDRRRPARERLRPDDVAQHADRVRRRVRLHRRRLHRLVPRSGLQQDSR